jgi:hypothetical protein
MKRKLAGRSSRSFKQVVQAGLKWLGPALLAILWLMPTLGFAQVVRHWQGPGTPVSLQVISIAANDSTLIYTTGTSSGGDPVLHVWDIVANTEVAQNDNLFTPNA